MAVIVGVARETASGERRVALTPETCKKLVAAGASVRIQPGIGDGAHFPDQAYADAGAELREDALAEADAVLCVQPPATPVLAGLKPGAVLVGSLQPQADEGRAAAIRERCLLAFQRLQQSGLLLQLDFLGPQQIPGCLVFVGKRVHFTVETVLLLGQILNLAFSLAQIVSLINDFLQLVENQIPRFMNLLLQIFDCRRLLFQ